MIVLERSGAIGGQVWFAGHGPSHRELAASLTRNYDQRLDRPNVDLRLEVTADADTVASHEPDVVIVATGARPFESAHHLDGVAVLHVWDILAGARPNGHIVISDWGGDAAALDCAELLAEEGLDVTLAVGSVLPGETLHQYVRNSYIGRLSRAGVPIRHYLGLHSADAGTIRFRNIFAPELETVIEADVLALSLGRVPNDDLARAVARSSACTCTRRATASRRARIEEAILEGTLAARASSADGAARRDDVGRGSARRTRRSARAARDVPSARQAARPCASRAAGGCARAS